MQDQGYLANFKFSFEKIKKNNTVTLCNKSENIILHHYFLYRGHMRVEILLIEMSLLSHILTLLEVSEIEITIICCI